MGEVVRAVAGRDCARMLAALPAAGCHQVRQHNARQYLLVLESARAEKHSGELSQAEIQVGKGNDD